MAGDTSIKPVAATYLLQNSHVVIGNNVGATQFEYVKCGTTIAGVVSLSAALQYAHSVGDTVYLITETTFCGNPTLGYNAAVAQTPYSIPVALPPGQYVVVLQNTDATNSASNQIQVWASGRAITAIS